MAKSANHIRWGYGITLGIATLFSAVAVAIGLGGGSGSLVVFGAFAGIAGIVFIVYAIRALILLFKMRKALLLQTQFASAIWARQVPPSPLQ